MVRRWNHGSNDLEDDYPYRSHGQPITAYVAIASCLFILIIANGASLWKNWNTNAFLSAYLAVSRSQQRQASLRGSNSFVAHLLHRLVGDTKIYKEGSRGSLGTCRFIEWGGGCVENEEAS
jgi:hypothetical protein